MKSVNNDIGSSFYLLQEDDWEFNALPKHEFFKDILFSYYYSGRNAILAVLQKITSQQTINTIWLPSYYCDTVVNLVTSYHSNIHYYKVNPFEFENSIDYLSFSKENDVVILNNFWGLSSFQYSASENKPIIIEDHSHGWLSDQSINSKADYCISSLRKIYPIPLGAVVWQPNTKIALDFYLDTFSNNHIHTVYNDINQSMLLKRDFIKNGRENVKNEYLALINKGEIQLNFSNHFIKPDNPLLKQIEIFSKLNPNPIKKQNIKFILNHLNNSTHFKIIKREDYIPFGLLLLFTSKEIFNSFKIWLVSHGIYPAHLWPNTNLDSKWKYLFNLHIDFRYHKEDMSYLVEKINIWSKNNV